MKRHLLLQSACLTAMLLAVAGVSAEEGWVRKINREMRPYTRLLPPVDRVELQTLEPWSHGLSLEVIETKTIEGEAAQRIAALWRKQNWNYKFSAACHEPLEAIKFMSGDKVVLYASICWECSNIHISVPIRNSQGFDADSKSGQQLLQIFTTAFRKNKQ